MTFASLLPVPFIARLCRKWIRRLQELEGIGVGAFSLEAETRVATALLPARDAIVLDVGGNRGDWTRALLAQADDRIAAVYVFEPSRSHRDALAGLPPKCTHVPAALGDAPGELPLYSTSVDSGLSSLHQRKLDHIGIAMEARETVAVTTLDAFAEGRGLERVDFLKLDVEGHELAVLRGAARLLRERRIRALQFEFGGTDIDSRTFFRDFWYLLSDAGFRVSRILADGRLLPIERYGEELEVFHGMNYAAVQRER